LVEVVEKDGSRWIATVPIGPEWRHCAVPTSAFHYWNDSPTRNRGAAGDYLHPQNADRMAIGIAVGHEPGGISPGAHEWSAAQLGTAASPLTDEDMDPLALECLLPWYKQFKLDDVGQVSSTLQGGVLGVRVPGGELAGPAWCSISRPAGMTWRDGDTLGRFVPLLQSVDSTGEARANLAWMWDVHAGVYSPGRWAQLALPYSDDLAPTLLALVRGLDRPVMLARAGTGAWSYFDDEPGQELGAYVLAKDASGPLTVRFVVRTEDGRTVADESSDIRPEGGRMTLARAERVTGLQAGFYSVRVTLLSEGKPIDVLDQPFTVLPARAPAEGRVHLSADGTHFEVDGRQFHPHGCNYWPLYVAGADSAQYWGHWLSPSQYDPEAVERDLRILERLGGNLVSIQYANEGQARPLADFLARCARHGIRANVFLPSTHPLAFDRELARRLIEAARLAGNPSVFAYDLAWEPHLGPYESRRAYDPQWRQWLADQYGSIEAAEAVFGMPLPRDSAAEVTGPSDAQLVQPSPATGPDPRVFVCAYRRFVDDMISVGYGEVKWFIRKELGDDTLLGARTGYGGTGQPWVQSQLPYDLVSGAAHLDFTSPEGYGLDGEWANFRRGGFTTQYGRWAGNGKPVFWAEFGRSVFSGEEGPAADLVERQRSLYENTYRMVLESRADGSACWWWPGGYRVDEKSDFGIISSDGTPRPSALELLRFSEDTRADRSLSTPTAWITFDRDASPRGYAEVWEKHREQYAAIIGSGGWVGLKTEATGTTTHEFPSVSVGNIPWRPGLPYTYLNGELHGLHLDARSIEVDVVNTGEVAWEAGAIAVSGTVGGREVVSVPLTDPVPRYGTTTVRATLPEGTQGELVLRLRLGGNAFGMPVRHIVP
jgi:hypothetical protein